MSDVNDDGLAKEKPAQLVPPDGGWGWAVVFGSGLISTVHLSIVSIFGLLYAPEIIKMGYGAKAATSVANICLFTQNIFGPLTGSIIKATSYRKTAVLGNILASLGMVTSAFSTKFWQIVITYGILRGIGMSMLLGSTFVSVNAYFKKKKSRALGLSFCGLYIGQIIWPYLVQYLLDEFSYRGATLVVSGIVLHGLIGAVLMQPVKNHMVKQKNPSREEQALLNKQELASFKQQEIKEMVVSITVDSPNSNVAIQDFENTENSRIQNNNTSVMSHLIKIFDLDLLTNYHFVVVIIGSSIAFASAMNFIVIAPLLLMDMFKNDTRSVTLILSIMSAADLVGLTLLPIILEKLKVKPFQSIIIGCVFLTGVRQVFTLDVSITTVIIASMVNGMWKTIILLYQNIAVSNECRLDQVPSAVGITMMVKGLFLLPAGYLTGWIKDYTGSFAYSIAALNAMTLIVIIMWLILISYDKWKSR